MPRRPARVVNTVEAGQSELHCPFPAPLLFPCNLLRLLSPVLFLIRACVLLDPIVAATVLFDSGTDPRVGRRSQTSPPNTGNAIHKTWRFLKCPSGSSNIRQMLQPVEEGGERLQFWIRHHPIRERASNELNRKREREREKGENSRVQCAVIHAYSAVYLYGMGLGNWISRAKAAFLCGEFRWRWRRRRGGICDPKELGAKQD